MGSYLHPCRVAKFSTSFGWDKGRKVASPEWLVSLCDPMWHVISRSGEMVSTNCYIRIFYFPFTSCKNLWFWVNGWRIQSVRCCYTGSLALERKIGARYIHFCERG